MTSAHLNRVYYQAIDPRAPINIPFPLATTNTTSDLPTYLHNIEPTYDKQEPDSYLSSRS
jgi:hypothetical protein